MFKGASLAYSRLIRGQATSFRSVSVFCHVTPKSSWATVTNANTKPPLITAVNTNPREFHTTPGRFIHPVVALVLRNVSRTVSVFTGKVFREWWKKQSKDNKDYYKKKYFFNPVFWVVPFGILTIGGGAYYISHIDTAPITGRKRFIAFNKEQMNELSDSQVESQLEEAKGKIVDPKNAMYIKVEKIVDRLIKSNQDIDQVKSQKWTIHVIDEVIENAFVLPNGHIFVYTGIIKVTKNDDQLAAILGHEMAHAVLSHGAEKISFAGFVNLITVISLAFIWALIPGDSLPRMVESIQDKLLSLLMELPYSRLTELEADKVGLVFMSKACYDVRESSILWRNFAALTALKSGEDAPEFLSTHPSHENRAEELDRMIPEAIKQRELCSCPELKGALNKVDMDFLKSLVEKEKAAAPAPKAAAAAVVK